MGPGSGLQIHQGAEQRRVPRGRPRKERLRRGEARRRSGLLPAGMEMREDMREAFAYRRIRSHCSICGATGHKVPSESQIAPEVTLQSFSADKVLLTRTKVLITVVGCQITLTQLAH